MKESLYIYGKYAVYSALEQKPACVTTVFMSEKYLEDAHLQSLLTKNNVKFETFTKNHLPEEIESEIDSFGTHQGIAAKIVVNKLIQDGKEFIKSFDVKQNSLFVILGEISDPQNVGAILRSAAAFGADGVFLPEHNQAPINGAVVKISAGAAFTVPLLSIGNINQTIATLKEKRFWIYGLEGGEGNTVIYKENFTEPSVFIIGNEHDGLREKTREHCDILVSIPISKTIESLNAATSAAVALYEFRKQNTF